MKYKSRLIPFKRSLAILLAMMIASLAMIIPALPVSAVAVPVTLYPTSGPPGTDVVILGNFTAGSTYTVTFGALTPVATGIVETIDSKSGCRFSPGLFGSRVAWPSLATA